jgi:hypothetical protein
VDVILKGVYECFCLKCQPVGGCICKSGLSSHSQFRILQVNSQSRAIQNWIIPILWVRKPRPKEWIPLLKLPRPGVLDSMVSSHYATRLVPHLPMCSDGVHGPSPGVEIRGFISALAADSLCDPGRGCCSLCASVFPSAKWLWKHAQVERIFVILVMWQMDFVSSAWE